MSEYVVDTLCWKWGRHLIVMDIYGRRRWSIVLDLRGWPLGVGCRRRMRRDWMRWRRESKFMWYNKWWSWMVRNLGRFWT